MAKKGLGDEIKETILEIIKGQLVSRLKEQFDDLVDKMHDAVVITQQKLVRAITALALFIVGLIAVIFGCIYLLVDIYGYSRSTVLLVTGAVLVLISIILAQSARLLKYHLKR